MFKLSQMTWLEIRQAPRHGLGQEKIAKEAISIPVPPQVSEDAELIALRYFNLHPMVGFRDGRIFYILFVDHKMDLYRH